MLCSLHFFRRLITKANLSVIFICSFDSIYEQATVHMPVIFILSPGSEPSSDIQKLGERCGVDYDHIKFISLGQGQEQVRKDCFIAISSYFSWVFSVFKGYFFTSSRRQ